MSRRDVDECGAHREGSGRCWPKSSVKGERLRSSFRDPRGVRIYLRNSLLVFIGSCSLSWTNGAAGRAVGQSARFKCTDKNPC